MHSVNSMKRSGLLDMKRTLAALHFSVDVPQIPYRHCNELRVSLPRTYRFVPHENEYQVGNQW